MAYNIDGSLCDSWGCSLMLYYSKQQYLHPLNADHRFSITRRRPLYEKTIDYLKNHWTKHRLVCKHSDAFSIPIPNMGTILNNSEFFWKFSEKMNMLTALDSHVMRVQVYWWVDKHETAPAPFFIIMCWKCACLLIIFFFIVADSSNHFL